MTKPGTGSIKVAGAVPSDVLQFDLQLFSTPKNHVTR